MLTQQDIDNIKQSLSSGIQVVAVPQLFETPNELAERMANLILAPTMHRDGLKSWSKTNFDILEPSGGTGKLIGALGGWWHPEGSLTTVEINYELCQRLKTEFPLTRIIHDDFLQCNDLGKFDRIIMNPPFINGSDIKHIKHAWTMIKTGGRLIAICANGPRQQAQLKPLAENSGGYYEPLPAGTFKDKGTNVNTALLVIEG